MKNCLSAHNQQKHRANLFLKNHLAGFIQSSRILIKKFKKGLALPKGNCLAVTNELEENPMSCSRSQSFCVTKIFVLSVMKPQTSATVWMLNYHKGGGGTSFFPSENNESQNVRFNILIKGESALWENDTCLPPT